MEDQPPVQVRQMPLHMSDTASNRGQAATVVKATLIEFESNAFLIKSGRQESRSTLLLSHVSDLAAPVTLTLHSLFS